MITKGDLVNGALALMRISGLTRQPTPEDLQTGLEVADDYAAELSVMLPIPYIQPATYGQSDPSDNSGLTPQMAGAFKKLLVGQLLGFYGKEIPPSVGITATQGLKALEHLLVDVPLAQNPSTLPVGSGNEYNVFGRKFYSEAGDNNGASYVFQDDVWNYTRDFSEWLVDATLVSVDWTVSKSGIVIASESFTDTAASAELTFNQIGGYTLYIKATKTGSTDQFTVTKNIIVKSKANDAASGFV